jgi:hypothetical protein
MSEEVTQLMGKEEIGVIKSPRHIRHDRSAVTSSQLRLKLIDRTRSYPEAHLIVSSSHHLYRTTMPQNYLVIVHHIHHPSQPCAQLHNEWHDDAGGRGGMMIAEAETRREPRQPSHTTHKGESL